MTALRWGLLGTARINRSVIPAIRAGARSQLAAVASRTRSRARNYAEEWGIPHAHDSYAALVEDSGIDAVYVPLPNHLHAEWTVRAARAGKHVLCEKPLALSAEDVDRVTRAAKESRVVVAEAFMYRHHPQTLKLQALVEEGAIGALKLVRGAFSYELTREGDVRLDPEMGGGCLWDVGCYPLGYARLLAGAEPIEVFGWQRLGPTGVDLDFVAQLRFPDGVLAQIDASFAAALRTELEVVGSRGTIRVERSYKPGSCETLRLSRGNTVEPIEVRGPEHPYLAEIEDSERAALDGSAPAVSLDDSRANVTALVALRRSAEQGRPVRLD